MIRKSILGVALLLLMASCTSSQESKPIPTTSEDRVSNEFGDYSKAYFASGCFWCVEEIFESVKGVVEVISGYAGGKKENADYGRVSAGKTKHAEAVEVIYDPEIISYHTLLQVFFGSHDPTTKNRQGPDHGTQYRSAIFYQNEIELNNIQSYIQELKENKTFNGPITTEVSPYEAFYPAEDYHQDYVRNHPDNGYVRNVSIPRFEKFKKQFPELLKE